MAKRLGQHVGARIYKLRVERGISQEQLERLAGIGIGAVSRMESGQRGYGLTLEKAWKLSRALGISLDELVTGSPTHRSAPMPAPPAKERGSKRPHPKRPKRR